MRPHFKQAAANWESAVLPPAPRWNESVFQGWCRISPQARCSPQTQPSPAATSHSDYYTDFFNLLDFFVITSGLELQLSRDLSWGFLWNCWYLLFCGPHILAKLWYLTESTLLMLLIHWFIGYILSQSECSLPSIISLSHLNDSGHFWRLIQDEP